MEFLLALGAGAFVFFVLGYVLERLDLLGWVDEYPCPCEACSEARRVAFRSF
jgi:hypothetical protein